MVAAVLALASRHSLRRRFAALAETDAARRARRRRCRRAAAGSPCRSRDHRDLARTLGIGHRSWRVADQPRTKRRHGARVDAERPGDADRLGTVGDCCSGHRGTVHSAKPDWDSGRALARSFRLPGVGHSGWPVSEPILHTVHLASRGCVQPPNEAVPPFVRWASIAIFASMGLLDEQKRGRSVELSIRTEGDLARRHGRPTRRIRLSVVIDGLDVDEAALPVLVRMRHLPRGSCPDRHEPSSSAISRTQIVSRHICATRARDILGSWPHFEAVVQVTRCRAIAPTAESFVTRNRMRCSPASPGSNDATSRFRS